MIPSPKGTPGIIYLNISKIALIIFIINRSGVVHRDQHSLKCGDR